MRNRTKFLICEFLDSPDLASWVSSAIPRLFSGYKVLISGYSSFVFLLWGVRLAAVQDSGMVFSGYGAVVSTVEGGGEGEPNGFQ